MKSKTLAICLFTAFALLGCTQARPTITQEQESTLLENRSVAVIEEPTAAMLTAALKGDPAAMRDAITNAGTCHTATTCPGFASCTGWSALAFCGDTCTKHCCHDRACTEPDIGGTVFNEQFRVCFNPAGASCTEWNVTSQVLCGC